jgi:Leucine-rich repeat (LRR) protein
MNWTKFTAVTGLIISNSNLDRFESRVLGSMAAQLRYLCLQANGLTTLSSSSLTGMPQLEQLFLDDQPSLTFPVDLLRPVPNLVRLRFHKLGLTSLPPALLAHLTSLQFLTVTQNPIRSLNTQPLTNVPLKSLVISDMQLTVLNGSMLAPFPNLTLLDIARVPLRDCPETTFDAVPQLQVLEWSGSFLNLLQVVLTARHLYPLTQLRNLDIDNQANSRESIEQWGVAFAQRYTIAAVECHVCMHASLR